MGTSPTHWNILNKTRRKTNGLYASINSSYFNQKDFMKTALSHTPRSPSEVTSSQNVAATTCLDRWSSLSFCGLCRLLHSHLRSLFLLQGSIVCPCQKSSSHSLQPIPPPIFQRDSPLVLTSHLSNPQTHTRYQFIQNATFMALNILLRYSSKTRAIGNFFFIQINKPTLVILLTVFHK